jgi:ADP-ribosylglycohydrolase
LQPIQSEQFISRAKGALLGLALGDALGTTLEFKSKDSYAPITDMNGGGPFSLQAGQWTDDTSMALCLADSLLATGKCSLDDQIQRYVRWWKEGENSVTGRCFDIGNTVSSALRNYLKTGSACAGSTADYSAGNGSLMRLAPIAIFFAPTKNVSLTDALEAAKQSSLTTHGEIRTYQSCQVMTWLLYQLFSHQDVDKQDLFEGLLTAFDDLHPHIMAIVEGSFLRKSRDEIFGTGFVVQSLEAALWAFANSNSFEEGALLAANLGDDADTTAAIYGQLAGAFYGTEGLPKHWLDKLAWNEKLIETAALLATVPTVSQSHTFLDSLEGLEGEEFFGKIYKLLYEHNLMLAEFDWPYFESMHLLGISLEYDDLEDRQEKIKFLNNMSYIDALKCITAIIRQDRFSDGVWDGFKEDGSLQLWLKRLTFLVKGEAG